MHIKKLIVKNFKKFQKQVFDFNDDLNIIVGDNESGKSTLLEAIELCLNFTYRGKPLNAELSTDLFNQNCVQEYLAGEKTQTRLPEILIEAYIDGCPELKGTNNSLGEDCEGVFVRIFFNQDMASSLAAFTADPEKVKTIPVELYKTEWYGFHWDPLSAYNKKLDCLFVDPVRLHPTYGKSRYINNILSSSLSKADRASLNLSYRQLKVDFDQARSVKAVNDGLDPQKEVSDKKLAITTDISSKNTWESGLDLSLDDITFSQIGKGEQNQIQIKLALRNGGDSAHIVMLEEPENHLSHSNLTRLIDYVDKKKTGKQVFITTHSSYVLNKLSINKLCLLGAKYSRLSEVGKETIKTLKRLPGYDTLRVVLAEYVVLVEGPSDELVLKKIYKNAHCGKLPEYNGIDIIVVRGLGFKTYLDIAKAIGRNIRVVKDNDGDHQKNIVEWKNENYPDYDLFEIFSPPDDTQNSLEPSLIEANARDEGKLDAFAKVIFSELTNAKFLAQSSFEEKKTFIRNWFDGDGTKKVDSAVRIFDGNHDIEYPQYLKEAVTFAS